MAKIKIENRSKTAFCLLPKSVTNYLSEAGADELRALLLLLSHEGDFSQEDAQNLGMTMERFVQCISFWNERKMLDGLHISLDDTVVKNREKEGEQAPLERKNLHSFIEMAEVLLGRILSTVEISTLYDICEELAMPPEVIILLIEYCTLQGKTSVKYIERVAATWVKNNILTHDKAVAHIEEETKKKSYEGHLRRMFHIKDREFSPSEKKIIQSWQQRDYSEEMLLTAYDKTVTNTGKVALAYMDKILQNWHEAGPGSDKSGRQGEYAYSAPKGRLDYDEFERRSLEMMIDQSKKGK